MTVQKAKAQIDGGVPAQGRNAAQRAKRNVNWRQSPAKPP
jgi:hypothetical protein